MCYIQFFTKKKFTKHLHLCMNFMKQKSWLVSPKIETRNVLYTFTYIKVYHNLFHLNGVYVMYVCNVCVCACKIKATGQSELKLLCFWCISEGVCVCVYTCVCVNACAHACACECIHECACMFLVHAPYGLMHVQFSTFRFCPPKPTFC